MNEQSTNQTEENLAEHPCNTELESRRRFLKRTGTALAVVAVASASASMAQRKRRDQHDDDENRGNMTTAFGKGVVSVGAVTSFKVGSMTDKTATAGVVIARTSQGLIALSPACTHQGCAVHAAGAQLVCPCHGAHFANTGAMLSGPARTPLSRYAVSIKNGQVMVDTSKLIARNVVSASDFVKV